MGPLPSPQFCPLCGLGGPPARQLTPSLPCPQGLLEDKTHQLFFGEVGRQMVTGLMTKAEKVAAGGALFPGSLPPTFLFFSF